MPDIKVLFSGCSLTADSGFHDKNLDKHWVNIVSKELGFEPINIAIGGMSNLEIFKRSIHKIIEIKPDLVVVMWSDLHRLWCYTNHLFGNIDNFTIIRPNLKGWQSKLKEIANFKDIYSKIFTNNYVAFRDWLLYIYGLQNLLKQHNIPFIFLRGFSNNLQDWITIDKNNLSKSSNFIKETLDFENNPDYYMIEKIDSLNNIINVIDKLNWVNFYTPSFVEIAIDRADDNAHPGKLSNKKMANEFIDYYKEFTF